MEDSLSVAVYYLSVYLLCASVVAVYLLNKSRREQMIQLRWINVFVLLVAIVVFAQSLIGSLANYEAVISVAALSQVAMLKSIVLGVLLVECAVILMLMIIKYFKTKTPTGLASS